MIEEQIDQQIANLSSSISNPSKLSSNIDLSEGLKALPFCDESFRLSFIENWYLISDPVALDSATHCLRYMYDSQEIYLRSLNAVFLLLTKKNVSFHSHIFGALRRVWKLSQCIDVWFHPQILRSQKVYYENYSVLEKALLSVNSEIKKLAILSTMDL